MDKIILKGLNIYSECLSPEKKFVGANADFWNYLNLSYSAKDDVYDVFPELVGRETEINALFTQKDGLFKIPTIRWENCFFDLIVFSPKEGSVNATVVIQDISFNIEQQRAILQKRNELVFLNREIQLRNAELSEARKTLDSIMQQARNKEHELSIEVRKQNKELQNTRLWFISTLARAAEFREQETGGHLYRIGRSCVLIGKKLGLSSTECETLFYASLLHDVGKIGIPDSILIKPGPLDEQEWEIMQTHTTIGANLLSRHDHPLFEAARDVAASHHERWDGKGYPSRLAGHDIPLCARICAVADVYDALVSDRVYKRAWSSEEALKVISTGSGGHFDPTVVKAFFDVLPAIKQLERYSEEDIDELEPEFI